MYIRLREQGRKRLAPFISRLLGSLGYARSVTAKPTSTAERYAVPTAY
jgi:hypothetical protein